MQWSSQPLRLPPWWLNEYCMAVSTIVRNFYKKSPDLEIWTSPKGRLVRKICTHSPIAMRLNAAGRKTTKAVLAVRVTFNAIAMIRLIVIVVIKVIIPRASWSHPKAPCHWDEIIPTAGDWLLQWNEALDESIWINEAMYFSTQLPRERWQSVQINTISAMYFTMCSDSSANQHQLYNSSWQKSNFVSSRYFFRRFSNNFCGRSLISGFAGWRLAVWLLPQTLKTNW